jgi:hypothetical protein
MQKVRFKTFERRRVNFHPTENNITFVSRQQVPVTCYHTILPGLCSIAARGILWLRSQNIRFRHSTLSLQYKNIIQGVRRVTAQFIAVLLTICQFCHCLVTTAPELPRRAYTNTMWHSRGYIFKEVLRGNLNLCNENLDFTVTFWTSCRIKQKVR